MSVAAAAKAALVGANGALGPLLDGVQVTYSEPRDVLREVVYGGDVTGPVQLSAMSAGVRVRIREDLVLQLHVRVWKPGAKTTEVTDARAVAIGDVIAGYITANTTLGGVENLKLAQVSGVDLSGWSDDDGSGSLLTIAVGLMSQI